MQVCRDIIGESSSSCNRRERKKDARKIEPWDVFGGIAQMEYSEVMAQNEVHLRLQRSLESLYGLLVAWYI